MEQRIKWDIHSALEDRDRHVLQHIKCNANHFYSFFFIFIIPKIILVKYLSTLHILPLFYKCILINVMTYVKE